MHAKLCSISVLALAFKMSCSKLKRSAFAEHYKYDDGVSFLFRFSRAANLALRAVDIVNGVPKLRFEPSQNVPALSEEDVAVIVKLCLTNKRPCFFYKGFHPIHPFARLGRLFKRYNPSWLRGTSVGKVLAEVDWSMKCLHAGVRSNADKTEFRSWEKTSNTTGLKTRADFDEDYEDATIMLQCMSADIDEEKDELYFVTEPKLRIDCVRGECNLQYSKYITERLDSIAYHDEPLFLKFREIIKLVLAIEWLKKKMDERNLKFSQVWISEHLEKRKRDTPQGIEVTIPSEKKQQLLDEMVKTKTDRPLVLLNSPRVFKNESGTGIEVVKTRADGSQKTVRASFDDYDVLFKDEDPDLPTNLEVNDCTGQLWLPRPNVKTWNELYKETVPQPCSVLYTADGFIERPVTGGVSTSSFPVNRVKREHHSSRRDEIPVRNGERVNMSYHDTPKPKPTVAPSPDIGVITPKSEPRDYFQTKCGASLAAGISDCSSLLLQGKNGEDLTRQRKLEAHTGGSTRQGIGAIDCPHEVRELRRDGSLGSKIKLHKQLLPPHAKSRNLADECAKSR